MKKIKIVNGVQMVKKKYRFSSDLWEIYMLCFAFIAGALPACLAFAILGSIEVISDDITLTGLLIQAIFGLIVTRFTVMRSKWVRDMSVDTKDQWHEREPLQLALDRYLMEAGMEPLDSSLEASALLDGINKKYGITTPWSLQGVKIQTTSKRFRSLLAKTS